jgi:hypothetical protein
MQHFPENSEFICVSGTKGSMAQLTRVGVWLWGYGDENVRMNDTENGEKI